MSTNAYIKSGEQPRYFSFGTNAAGGKITSIATPTVGDWIPKESPFNAFQAFSAAASTVKIEATNDPLTISGANANVVLLATITQAGAGSDGFPNATTTQPQISPYRWVRANVTAATTATSVIMGV